MEDVFHGSATYPAYSEGPVVTIGNFDGVHLGHQVLLGRTLELARSLNRASCAFTFHPAPRDVLRPDNPVLRIQRPEDRIACLLAAGMTKLFWSLFHSITPKDARWFAEEVLGKRLNASAVVGLIFDSGEVGQVDMKSSRAG